MSGRRAPSLDLLFETLSQHERKFNRSFSLIPSENRLSPLARAAFLSDAFSRYFFDEHETFGRWSFEGGSIAGRIQQEIVVPLLAEFGRARFVNLHPVSGLTGMTLGLAAFGGPPGSAVLSVPVACGGHPDTGYVARKLGYEVHELPFEGWERLDLELLGEHVERLEPTLIYVDHATALLPLDLEAMIATVRHAAHRHVHVHVDTSHVNGLVWAGQLPNPLVCGADSYGGSTHKTFPGPHKAVLFTNDPDVAERLTLTAVNMISHHHLSSVIALGITLLEFRDCGGAAYAAQIIRNAHAFAHALAQRDVAVQGPPGTYTKTHQVWAATPTPSDAHGLASRLFRAGLVVNPYDPLPSLGGLGIRMGVNEPTRLGLREPDMDVLAEAYAAITLGGMAPEVVAPTVAELRAGFETAYCYPEPECSTALATLAAALEDVRVRHLLDLTTGNS
jgi:glycine hydroxymethyltransferase